MLPSRRIEPKTARHVIAESYAESPQTLGEDHHCRPRFHMALVVKGGGHALDTCEASSQDGEHLRPKKFPRALLPERI